MNIPANTQRYYLFDGALLNSTAPSWLLEQPGLYRLYDDLGEQAASVGPWLLPTTDPVNEYTRTLLTSGTEQRFACSGLTCRAPLPALLEHLRALRYLQSGGTQRYYFRYADGRAFSDLWRTLTPAQRRATLGPINTWNHLDLTGNVHKALAPHPDEVAAEVSLPLRLQPQQWHQLIENGRIGELFDATAQIDDGLPPHGQPHERYHWTCQTYAWLRRMGVESVPVQVAANRVIWQTAGLLLKQEQFQSALLQAQRSGDISRVLEFAQIGTGRRT
ncbi:DUF4123 domain-containing protein [Pseudomonas sp. R5(2019)]|uniref:DUF4123 domain-containing protein n=1 Tax=Pseudomonas sp. R5(2019) TaxID=2697566 RepID=UPI001412AAB8|nr:DUF4123 domain-containing protein [Pseudomonas sp. R5(2019)]NBA95429.1 DUF4123 domain-containing protein [Pseudomonas sp. R5(2019)]